MAGRFDGSVGLAWLFPLFLLGGLTIALPIAQEVQGFGWPGRLAATSVAETPPSVELAMSSVLSDDALADGAEADEPGGDAAKSGPVSASLPSSPDIRAGGRAQVANTDNQGVILRTAPLPEARVPRGLMEGARVSVLDRSGPEWVHVRGDNGLEGWMPAQYLKPIASD
jgi:Bacterial SH3 domain